MFQKGHLVGGPRPLGHIVLGQAVAKVNQQPTAYSDSATTAYQTPVDIDLITNDIDLDGSIDASSVEITTQPVNGVVAINASNGVATYTPHDGFSGADSFEYRVSDTEGKWSEPVAVNLLVEPLQRNFTYLEKAGAMYYASDTNYTLSGDMEISFTLMPELITNDWAVVDSGTFNSNRGEVLFYWDAPDGFQLILGSQTGFDRFIFGNPSSLQVGAFNRVSLKRTNGQFSMTVNGEALPNTLPESATRDFDLNLSGYFFGGNSRNFTGIVDFLEIWHEGHKDTGTLVLSTDFGIDFDRSNYIDTGPISTLTEEKWDASAVQATAGVTTWDSGTGIGHVDTPGDYAAFRISSAEPSKWYKISFELFDVVAGQLQLRLGSNDYAYSAAEAGTYDLILQAMPLDGEPENTLRAIEFKREIFGEINDFKIKNISVKEIDGHFLRPVNMTRDEVVTGTYSEDRVAWLGDDLITQTVWENPSYVQETWDYVPGSDTWDLTGDGNLAALTLLESTNQPAVMLLEGEVVSVSGGNGLSVTSGNSTAPLQNDGPYEYVIAKFLDGTQQYKRRGGVVNASISKPSVRALWEVL